MKKIWFILLAVTACHSFGSDNYNQKLSTWMGRPVQALISHWGEPDSQFSINRDTMALVYVKSEKYGAFEPYRDTLNYEGISSPQYGYSMYKPVYYCRTTFSVRNGIIVDYAFEGDDCI